MIILLDTKHNMRKRGYTFFKNEREYLSKNEVLCVAAAAAAKSLQSCSTNSVRPHRRPPTRLLCPWDSPGKNTGVDCHFLLQYMKSESEVAQSCPTLSDLMDCSLPGSSIHGIFQARVLEWGAKMDIDSALNNSLGFAFVILCES